MSATVSDVSDGNFGIMCFRNNAHSVCVLSSRSLCHESSSGSSGVRCGALSFALSSCPLIVLVRPQHPRLPPAGLAKLWRRRRSAVIRQEGWNHCRFRCCVWVGDDVISHRRHRQKRGRRHVRGRNYRAGRTRFHFKPSSGSCRPLGGSGTSRGGCALHCVLSSFRSCSVCCWCLHSAHLVCAAS